MIATATCCILLGACASTEEQYAPSPEPPAFAQPFNRPPAASPEAEVKPTFATYNPEASVVFPDYRLNIGDVLEIIYHVRTGVSIEKYRLKVEDKVGIKFPFQPTLDQTVAVQSDGTIRLLLVGEILVVERGERGVGPYHFRENPDDRSWSRFDPASGQWQPCPYVLVRLGDGAWVRRDHGTGAETRLEDDIPEDAAGQPMYPCIVDMVKSDGRRDRYEYDTVQQLWKTRPIVIQQKGLTAGELQQKLQQEYAKYLRAPELTVTLTQANIKIEELKKAITTAPRGQSRLMPVKPDGTIDLPFVGEVPAYGKTIQQLKTEIETAYAQVDLPEISVTVQMNAWASLSIYVLGEVRKPGLMTVPTSFTLLQALATAGGTTPRSAEDLIMVIRRKGLPVPEATVVNMRALLSPSAQAKAGNVPDFSNLRFDFYVSDGDIIYVPNTALAVAGDWVDLVFSRIIRGVLPYSFYTGVNFGYEIYNAPSTTKVNSGGDGVNVQLGP